MLLENLWKLQQLEVEREALTGQIQPEEMKALGMEKKELVERIDLFARRKQELEGLDKDTKRLEDQLENLIGKKKDLSSRLYGGEVTNPKELQSLEEQVANLGVLIRKEEDKLLAIEEKKEGMENLIKREEQELDRLRKIYNEKVRKYKENAAAAKDRLADLKQAIDALEAAIDLKTLEKYRRLQKRLGIVVIARAHQGFCSGCGVQLHSMALQDLKFSDQLITCENCERILLIES
ncbi:MAG TPA: hypothetical protein GX711_03695 [Clostridia bacterium]|nr:hypothetical protein [Clostridia bacterium]